MAILPINGYHLHYSAHISDRNQPTLLFIHGLTMDASEWSPLVDRLGSDVNYIVYDSCGHRRTGTSNMPLSLELLVSESLAVIEAAGAKTVHIVGSGLGGNIGFELAGRHRERVASLTLMSAVFYLPEHDYSRMLALMKQLIDIDRDLLMQKLILDSFYVWTAEKSARFETAFRQIPAEVIKESVTLLQTAYSSERFHFVEELGRLTVPTLVMHGACDPIFPPQLSAVYSACIPNSRWYTVPEASRILPVDQPELTVSYLRKFILGEKRPAHVSPIHEEMVGGFRNVVRNGLISRRKHDHRLTMNVMHDIEVLWNGRLVAGKWNQRGAKELLLFLILRNGPVRRMELIETFLPDLPIVQARNNLRVWISHLNKIFNGSPDPSVHDILIINEDAIGVNAELESDLGIYLERLDKLVAEKKALNEQAVAFIRLLSDYDPANFSSFRSDWIFSLTDKIETKLADAMARLLPELKKHGMIAAMREILQAGKPIEPYDGYCDDKLAELQSMPQ
ncbi:MULTISPECIES: alpha/beta hydrolase [unclassified Sporolactobacillus]|uniref:alpha/beta hydrolase n=1 Tax=unclassified Sporolactobacillus TaxID=2628533 RepID=UPI0023677C29|nr:alpha/beta hydrolase [Sporolactobacillus sp. CQH2019]MDD9148230.1 alpha/beta fold hydrolase [Sporolactobacillus sp. CQH2019]